MIANFFSMNGYGLYIWLSFGVVIMSCAIIYLKTRRTLRKYEKEFLIEIENLSEIERQRVLYNSKTAKQILATTSRVK
tara:strand:- start:916 stop:1149 length:234 start_codon:yes stop_codon:yes gene_type:complete